MRYEYITEDNLVNRQNYQYSKFQGEAFLKAYAETRKNYLITVGSAAPMKNTGMSPSSSLDIDVLTKSFEVRKRIYDSYDEDMKPLDGASYEDLDAYLDLADRLAQTWSARKDLKYLSCLLKLDDTLLSVSARLSESQRKRLAAILLAELADIRELCEMHGVAEDIFR